jgi:hypothetical protein
MKKGQLKPPVDPIDVAFGRAMDLIYKNGTACAIFFLGGQIVSTKQSSRSFENNVARLSSGLVGVYDMGVDARHVREDLNEFYREHA